MALGIMMGIPTQPFRTGLSFAGGPFGKFRAGSPGLHGIWAGAEKPSFAAVRSARLEQAAKKLGFG
jgi:hypothetical protein